MKLLINWKTISKSNCFVMKTRQSRGEIEGSLTGDNYIFRELGSAMLQENIQGAEDNPYADVIYPDGNLDVTKLKGENPITYRIQASHS